MKDKEHVARMGQIRNAYILAGKPHMKCQFEKPREQIGE
jgi:hypothetical protein